MGIIDINNIDLTIGKTNILKNITVSFDEGKIHGLIGRNGSGKTMLMKCICGFIKPTGGEITVDGKRVGKDVDFPKNMGIIIETPGFIPYYSGYKNLKLLAGLNNKISKQEIKKSMEQVGLDPDLKRHVKKYSLGMRQRLGLAQAIMENPKILILDEPFNGLDKDGVADMRKYLLELKERGKTILISSHILSEIALLADDIGIIDHGVLLEENSMNELQKKNSKYILLQVSDIPKTSLVLERQFGVTEYSVQDEHTLRIYDTSLDMAAVNKALVVQDIAVISSQLCNDTLEDYFKKITGGEGIA